jgi:PAS domain S-box-containing protein
VRLEIESHRHGAQISHRGLWVAQAFFSSLNSGLPPATVLSAAGQVQTGMADSRVIQPEKPIPGTDRELEQRQGPSRAQVEKLCASERLYRAIVESANDVVFVIDRDDVVHYVNPSAAKHFGAEPEQLIGRLRSSLFPGPNGDRQRRGLQHVFETGEPAYSEHEGDFAGQIWLDTWLVPMKDSDGTVTHVLGVSRDVSQRRQVEQALKLRIELDELVATISRSFIQRSGSEIDHGILKALQQIGESMGVERCVVRLLSRDHERYENCYQWDVDQGEPSVCEEVIEVKDYAFARQQMLTRRRVAVPTLDSLPAEAKAERRFLESKGTRSCFVVPLLAAGTEIGYMGFESRRGTIPWLNDHEPLIHVLGEVLAGAVARKQAEESMAAMAADLLKAQKLESIGVLAGGIAHDFNNILTAIWGNLSLARARVTTDSAALPHLVEAEKALDRARDLTQQLLTFAKGGSPVKKLTTLEQLVRDSAGFATRGSNVLCEVVLAEQLWGVEVDEGQISQVIQNLVLNAVQAMADGGRIVIDGENVESTASLPPTVPPGRYVKVRIKDGGAGIAPKHLPMMFVPYFTTKPGGSGLGLATSYSIIKKHGGLMTVDSEVGVGTTFTLFLPAARTRAASVRPDAVQDLRGHGRVLVVDDEEAVRKCTSWILDELGYEVECVADGAEATGAYAKARSEGKPFDLVIVDLTIPGGVGGRETIQRLQREDPDVVAIASSGYSNDPVMSDHERFGFRGIIRKPYGIQQLGSALLAALRRGGRRVSS